MNTKDKQITTNIVKAMIQDIAKVSKNQNEFLDNFEKDKLSFPVEVELIESYIQDDECHVVVKIDDEVTTPFFRVFTLSLETPIDPITQTNIEIIADLEEKYFDLVWYARKSEEQYNTIPKVKENVDRIDEQYPKETENLSSENGDWHHGFNSGMLAGMRYVLSLYSEGKETADEEFPFLDT